MKTLKKILIISSLLLMSLILLCTGDKGVNGIQDKNGLELKYEGKDNSGLINYAVNFQEPRGDSGNAVVKINNTPVTYAYSLKGTSITFYDKASSVVVYKAQLDSNELSLQNSAGQSIALLKSVSSANPDDTSTTEHSGKGILHPKYKGVMSGSDA
jgi:hypothetical protein